MMQLLGKLFRHHEEAVWRELSRQIGGEFLHEKGWRQDKVVTQFEGWTVTLDISCVAGYRSEFPYTRLRTWVRSPKDLEFSLHNRSYLSRMVRRISSHEIEVGDAEFDGLFIIKSRDRASVTKIFSHPPLREHLKAERNLILQLKPVPERVVDVPPEGALELRLMVEGEVNDLRRLRRLYDVFCEMLHQICVLVPSAASEPKQ